MTADVLTGLDAFLDRVDRERAARDGHAPSLEGAEAVVCAALGLLFPAFCGGGAAGPHPIQGIGAGFIPANLDADLVDGAVRVTGEEAKAYARRAAREEGLLVGISSGASLAAVAKTLPDLAPGACVLTYCYDTGERYLSVEGLFELPAEREHALP